MRSAIWGPPGSRKAGRPLGSASSALVHDGNCSKRLRSGLRLVNREHIDCILCSWTPGRLPSGVRRVLSGLDRDEICNAADCPLCFSYSLGLCPHSPETKPTRGAENTASFRPACWPTDPELAFAMMDLGLIPADRPPQSDQHTNIRRVRGFRASARLCQLPHTRLEGVFAGYLAFVGKLLQGGMQKSCASSGCCALGLHEVNEGCICHEARWRYEQINRWREVAGSRSRLRFGLDNIAGDHTGLEEHCVSFRHGILCVFGIDDAAALRWLALPNRGWR
ncbi:hypothetical protein QBC39DRAFT_172506 [Podospora conica]|nr:hypothetical protein QBC39DRAFT_172506 [Schizothecium conicum]